MSENVFMKQKIACISFKDPLSEGYLAISGIYISRMLSSSLYQEYVGTNNQVDLIREYTNRWMDLTTALSTIGSLEFFLYISPSQVNNLRLIPPKLDFAFILIGRGSSSKIAIENCSKSHSTLFSILNAYLNYLELQSFTYEEPLEQIAEKLLNNHNVVEIVRQFEEIIWSYTSHNSKVKIEIPVPDPQKKGSKLGFLVQSIQENKSIGISHSDINTKNKMTKTERLTYLSPWVPNNDSWQRLSEVILYEENIQTILIHFQPIPELSIEAEKESIKNLATVERILHNIRLQALKPTISDDTVLLLQCEQLRTEIQKRVSILGDGLLAARIFISSSQKVEESIIATLYSSLHDTSQVPNEFYLAGGSTIIESSAQEVFAPFGSYLKIQHLFGPREAVAVLRTPTPSNIEFPGIRINRFRTALVSGKSGEDCFIGTNSHHGHAIPIYLDDEVRFKHTYIIGQTGTGKSTLMQHMILSDICKGRGVAVLDPHGTMIDAILPHIPATRLNDIVYIDVADTEYPVGMNLLAIEESDPYLYRKQRDLVISSLYEHFSHLYNKDFMGPMFEKYFKGLLQLLMGSEKPLVKPNLMMLPLLFQREATEFRSKLLKNCKKEDFFLNTFVKEIEAITGEQGIQNMSSWVTSKTNRFTSLASARNILCQSKMIDFKDIVDNGKILLVDLGRGVIDTETAGIIAGQLVIRLKYAVMDRNITDPKSTPFYLHADEFQIFATPTMAELLAEARKFKLSLTIAHQYMKQVDTKIFESIIGNIGTFISLRVGVEDAKEIQGIFSPTFSSLDLSSLANYDAYLRSSGSLGMDPFSIDLTPPLGKGDETIRDQIKNLSRSKYAKPRLEVENEVFESLQKAYQIVYG